MLYSSCFLSFWVIFSHFFLIWETNHYMPSSMPFQKTKNIQNPLILNKSSILIILPSFLTAEQATIDHYLSLIFSRFNVSLICFNFNFKTKLSALHFNIILIRAQGILKDSYFIRRKRSHQVLLVSKDE